MSHRLTGRRPWSLLLALPAGALLALVPTPAAAGGGPEDTDEIEVWHRLDTSNDPPSHERLRCVETEAEDDEHGQEGEIGDSWLCRYDSVPGEGLSDPPFEGTFEGTELDDDDWLCPAWLGDVCESVDDVVAGTETFFDPGDPTGEEFPVHVELVILENGDLWVTWIESFFGTFSCPWYETFDEALASPSDCLAP